MVRVSKTKKTAEGKDPQPLTIFIRIQELNPTQES